jgi:hypothetical protein
MKVVIAGATGLIGTALCDALRRSDHEVVRLVRRSPEGNDVLWDPAAKILDAAAIDGADAVINLAGAGIGDKRWTDEYKKSLLQSRLDTTTLLADTVRSVDRKPAVFISGSAIGAYGPTGDEVLDEDSPRGTDFLADLCTQWEAAAQPAADVTRLVVARTGIVLSKQGGALKKQLPLFKLGLGGRFGSGAPWQSWISIDDEVGAIIHLLTSSLTGPVNLTAPNPVRNKEFASTLAKVLKRPAVLPIPAFGPRLLLGRELADALLFTGQRVVPTKLVDDGFRFAHPLLPDALRHILGR